MAYRLLGEESVEEGVKRIVGEQIDKAIGEIQNQDLDRHQTVHQVRKRCKKIRGTLRLVRPEFEETYRFENAWFRDAARRLSPLRDAEAMIETYDQLMNRFSDQLETEAFTPVRETLVLRRRQIADEQFDLDERLADFLTDMREARERVNTWVIRASGFQAINPGFQKTYRRGRKAMFKAYGGESTTEQFHEWRKRVKYHRYHTRLLRELWKPVMKQFLSEVKVLSDLLGDDHDLAVFRQTLMDKPDEFGEQPDIQVLLGLIDRRRAQLQEEARSLGERVYAEKPRQLVRRLEHYWRAWRTEVEDQPAGLAG